MQIIGGASNNCAAEPRVPNVEIDAEPLTTRKKCRAFTWCRWENQYRNSANSSIRSLPCSPALRGFGDEFSHELPRLYRGPALFGQRGSSATGMMTPKCSSKILRLPKSSLLGVIYIDTTLVGRIADTRHILQKIELLWRTFLELLFGGDVSRLEDIRRLSVRVAWQRTLEDWIAQMPYGDRKSERVDFERGIPVFIMGIDGTWRRDCRLVDVSQTGARLCVEGSIEGLDLKEFFLLLSSTGLAYRRCNLVRVAGDQIGVEFLARDKVASKTRAPRQKSTEEAV